MYEMKKSGWIEVICGSMFSGKSEELIRRVKRTQYAKQHVHVYKPMIDNRYSEENVVSHNGNSVVARPVSTSRKILNYVTADVDVVAIDEVQFFDDQVVEIVEMLANQGHRIIVVMKQSSSNSFVLSLLLKTMRG